MDVPTTQFNPRLVATLQSFSRVASATTILVGGLVLVGWVFDIPTLKSIVPGWATTKVNTALAFVLAGVALWLARTDQTSQRVRRGASACALLVALIGFLTLTEYLFGWDLGIDQLLVQESLAAAGTLAPGRMAPVTALNFFLLGVALLLLSRDRAYGLLQFLTLTALVVALLALIGYVYGVRSLYRIFPYVSVAIHTAATFMVLGLGLLCARPTRGIMRMIMRESAGGLLARRLLPAALVLPLVLGWLRLAGQRAGLYDTEFGLSIFVLATMSIFTVLIWWNARSLDRMDVERQHAAAAVHASEERTRATLEAALDGIITIDATGRVIEFNPAAEQIFSYRRADAVGRELADLIVPPATRDAHRRGLAQCVATGEGSLLGKRIELTAMRADGSEFPVEVAITRIVTDGRLLFTGFVRDLTARKSLEAQFLQAQKVESIGRLAGGIAHDFNNLLTAIAGYTDFARAALPADHPAAGDLAEVQKAAQRATTLTRQLLAFARKQTLEPRMLNLNDLIRDMDKLLRRVIGEDLDLVTQPASDLGQVRADPGQVEQVIVNLAVNARDAMPAGGKLTIETRNVMLDTAYAHGHLSVIEGAYILLAVSDTGVGMDAETQSHVFEPFFTTKEQGKGTGLGLATCYGIIKQHGGFIWVYSEVGHGTTIRIYLPRVYAAAEALPTLDEQVVPRGTEIVLLVEDELAVRVFAARVLRESGYTVLEASHGAEALGFVQEYPGAIQLLLTDVVLPQMGGKALAEHLTARYPTLKVLFMSGYADDAIVHHGQLAVGLAFLHKPFSPGALLRKVREVLDIS